MKRRFIFVTFVSCISLCACDPQLTVKENTQKNEIGRFQVFDTETGPFLVDTVSGDSWKYSRIAMKNGDLWDSGWFAIGKKDQYEINESFRLLEEHEAAKEKK